VRRLSSSDERRGSEPPGNADDLLVRCARTRLPLVAVPEGHTIHRLAIDHTRDLVGQTLEVTSPQGRMSDGAAVVSGTALKKVDPYGKHLFYRFGHPSMSRATTIHVHLGLFGKFSRFANPARIARDTTRLRMVAAKWTVDLVGPTDCRIVTPDEEQVIRDRLGPDPIRPDANPDLAYARLSKRRIPIGAALLDQKVMAGVGNVYRAEALFVHAIHPSRPANEVTRSEFDALWSTLVSMLRQGVVDKRIITVADDELEQFGQPRRRLKGKEAVYVYKKDHCLRCETEISRWDMAGRWAYACGTCQPR
jgi:endonuclease VIII